MSYVQLPDGSTLLHCIYDNKPALEYVYKTAQDPEDEDRPPFHIPLLMNEDNRTALDLAMKMHEEEHHVGEGSKSNRNRKKMMTRYLRQEEESA